MTIKKTKQVVIVVAHPDDETLWVGGTILSHPSWNCLVMSLCRADDADRAPRFYNAVKALGAEGKMAALNDGPEQNPLDPKTLDQAILEILPLRHFDLIITHNPMGEYTRHIRHEEVGRSVIRLWHAQKITTTELYTFAYEDGQKKYLPKPVATASIYRDLTKRIWLRKYSIIREIYGFDEDSFEALTTPRAEAFWQFTNAFHARKWFKNGGILNPESGVPPV